MSRYGEKKNLEVTILSGDRDTFQLATDKVTIRIPHTKGGKTETDLYNCDSNGKEIFFEPEKFIVNDYKEWRRIYDEDSTIRKSNGMNAIAVANSIFNSSSSS